MNAAFWIVTLILMTMLGGLLITKTVEYRGDVQRLHLQNEALQHKLDLCWQVQQDSARSCSYMLMKAASPCELPVMVE